MHAVRPECADPENEPDEESETAVYAIVRSGGQQRKVAVGDVIDIDKVATAAGESLQLPAVLLVDGDTVTSRPDDLSKVSVTAEVLGETKGPKITILKYKNKTGYRKRQGHRQRYTQVKVTDISTK
jgi:large subunit ribosomal protein L21